MAEEKMEIAVETGTEVICPEPGCGRPLRLWTIPGKPGRVQAFCNHGKMHLRPLAVYETDAVSAAPQPDPAAQAEAIRLGLIPAPETIGTHSKKGLDLPVVEAAEE